MKMLSFGMGVMKYECSSCTEYISPFNGEIAGSHGQHVFFSSADPA
jgi:hypothetical protein